MKANGGGADEQVILKNDKERHFAPSSVSRPEL
jgi:hypothetical protein